MIAPDGSVADVPVSSMDAALANGAQRGYEFEAPDGSRAVVPESSIQQALSAGAKPLGAIPNVQQPEPAAPSGMGVLQALRPQAAPQSAPQPSIPERGLLERAADLIPESADPALRVIEEKISTPLNRLAQRGAEIGGNVLRSAVGEVNLLARPERIGGPAYGPMPPRPSAEEMAGQEHPIVTGIAGGIGETVGGTVADVRNWPFFASGVARPLLQRLLSGGFGLMMGKDAISSTQKLYNDWDKLSPEQRANLITKGGLSAVMATAATAHAMRGKVGGAERGEAPPVESVTATEQVASERPTQVATPALPWMRKQRPEAGFAVPAEPPTAGPPGEVRSLSAAPPLKPEQMKLAYPNPGEVSKAEIEKGILREARGEMDRVKEQTYHRLEEAIHNWDRRPVNESLDFIDAIETGKAETLPPADKELAGQLRAILDDRRDTIRQMHPGALEHYLQHYFPHTWERPTIAQQMMEVLGKGRSAAGPASFLKRREFPTVAEGIKAGLKPVDYNPIRLMLVKLNEMDKFISAHDALHMMRDEGTAVFVKTGQKPPSGWEPLEDRIGEVYGRSKEGELVIRGNWYSPAEAARIFNRNLSPSLIGRSRTYDFVRGAANTLNSAQLGVSAYHLGFTSLDSMISDVSLGLQKLTQSKASGVGDIARGMTPVSPVANYVRGSRVLREYLEPGSYKKFRQEAEWVAKSGGRAFMDPVYRNNAIQGVRNAVKDGRYFTAMGRLPGAIVEGLAKPIMEHIVPRQKLGVFSKMASNILERASQEGWSNQKLRLEMNKAWDSVDNRMGQLVYDNLFWHRTFKDLAMISTRSLGWNLGSFREILGGAKDYALQTGKTFKGQKPELTSRMAYVAALPIVTGLYGAIIGYLSGHKPKELKDYFFPVMDDAGNRASLPAYMKDVYSWSHDPLTAAGHKTNPLLSTVADMVTNKDFFGTEIRNADDPIVQQLLDSAEYLAKQYEPFSWRNLVEQRKRDAGKWAQFGSFVGVTPAPAYISNSEAVNKAIEYMRQNRGKGTRTKEQAEASERRRMLADELRNKKAVDLGGEVRAGRIAPKDVRLIQQAAKESKLVRMSKSLPIEQLLKVAELATPDELKELRPILERRNANLLKSHSADEAKELHGRIVQLLTGRPAAATPVIPASLRKLFGAAASR